MSLRKFACWEVASVRRLIEAAVALGATGAILLSGTAWGDCGSGPISGNASPTLTTDRYAYGVWNGGTDTLDVTTHANNGLGSGKCVTGYFDWFTNGTGHFDSRAARTCDGNSYRSVNGGADWQELSYVNREIRAEQKLGVCHGDKDSMGNCQSYVADGGCAVDSAWPVNPNFPNTVTSAWIRRADGTVDLLEAPNPNYTSATS